MKALILQVFYQPEGVSLRFYPQPEANAFRLIQPNRCNNYYLFNLVSGTLSNACQLNLKSESDAPLGTFLPMKKLVRECEAWETPSEPLRAAYSVPLAGGQSFAASRVTQSY